MKFKFNVPDEFKTGIERLGKILNFETGEGIIVSAVQEDKLGVCLKDGAATIYYTQKHLFFRQLGILIHNAKTKTEFELFEDTFFEEMTVMLDTACGGVPTIDTLKKFLDYSVLMGYGIGMIYIEDGLELENYPYFGHIRGRYTKNELRAVDDYAFEYGIEIIPCIECYGHLGQYLFWPEADGFRDTKTVMLAREPKTFEFVEELIKTSCECVRSKRVHIGMDEAWDMGRGKFLDIHGYVDPVTILGEVMDEIMKIIKKYGLTPMMWIDMYFRNSNPGKHYLVKDINFSKETKDSVPENMQLVFWNYYYMGEDGEYFLEKSKELGRDVIFAGGAQGWIGHFPNNKLNLLASRDALKTCYKTGINKVMQTVWSNDGNECELFANLIGMSQFAEICFDIDADDKKLAERFFAVTGENFDAFMLMSDYHDNFENGRLKPHLYSAGKNFFWQDILEGMYDYTLFQNPMSEHYKTCAEQMNTYQGGEFDYLYRFATKCFEYLAIKTEIAQKLVPAYKADDKETLFDIRQRLLPTLASLTDEVTVLHKQMWDSVYKPTGWITLELRYAGVKSRVATAIDTLDKYLSGKLPSLYQLEIPRLEKKIDTRYGRISNVYYYY